MDETAVKVQDVIESYCFMITVTRETHLCERYLILAVSLDDALKKADVLCGIKNPDCVRAVSPLKFDAHRCMVI
jgi:hypothetical protein